MNELICSQNKQPERSGRLSSMVEQHVSQYIEKNQAYLWRRIKHDLVQTVIQDCRQNQMSSNLQVEENIYQWLKYILEVLKTTKKQCNNKDRYGGEEMQKQIAKLKKQVKQNEERVQRRNRKITKMENIMKTFYQNLSTDVIQISRQPFTINYLINQNQSMKLQIDRMKEIIQKQEKKLRRSTELSQLLIEKLQLNCSTKQNTVVISEKEEALENKNISHHALLHIREKIEVNLLTTQREDRCNISQFATNDVSIQADESSSYIYERDMQTQYQVPKQDHETKNKDEQTFLFPIFNQDVFKGEKTVSLQIQNADIKYQLDEIKQQLKEKEQIYLKTHTELRNLQRTNQKLVKENSQLKFHNQELYQAIQYANIFFNSFNSSLNQPPQRGLRKYEKTSNQSSKDSLNCEKQIERQVKKVEVCSNNGQVLSNLSIRDAYLKLTINKSSPKQFDMSEVKDKTLQSERWGKQNRQSYNTRDGVIKIDKGGTEDKLKAIQKTANHRESKFS